MAGLLACQRFLNVGNHRVRNVDILQDSAQPMRKVLFAEIWQFAFSASTSAVVIHVALLFYLRRDEAIVVAAPQQSAAESEFMMAMLGPVVASEDVLHALERRGIDEQWVRSFVGGVAPLVEANIKGILQDFVQIS